MSDPFRRLFLDQLAQILAKRPSHAAFLELLALATADFDATRCTDQSYIRKCYRTVVVRTHPDKHPQDVERATRFSQDLPHFFKRCKACPPPPPQPSRRNDGFSFGTSPSFSSSETGAFSFGTTQSSARRRTRPSAPSSHLPRDFNSSSKWPHIAYNVPYWEPNHTPSQVSSLVAHQCINARGAIAHGKSVGLVYSNVQAIQGNNWRSVRDVFEASGGSKELGDVDAIKEEIWKNGPIISTSFRPSAAFLANNFGLSGSTDQRDFLIVGWQLCATGEVWLIQPLYSGVRRASTISVSMGQYGIDEGCLAPVRSFEDQPWESGPYLDIDVDALTDAMGWRSTLSFTSATLDDFGQVESLFKAKGTVCFGLPPFSSDSGASFAVTIRNGKKHAHSRRGVLQSLEWAGDKWKAHVAFI